MLPLVFNVSMKRTVVNGRILTAKSSMNMPVGSVSDDGASRWKLVTGGVAVMPVKPEDELSDSVCFQVTVTWLCCVPFTIVLVTVPSMAPAMVKLPVPSQLMT